MTTASGYLAAAPAASAAVADVENSAILGAYYSSQQPPCLSHGGEAGDCFRFLLFFVTIYSFEFLSLLLLTLLLSLQTIIYANE